MNPHDEVGSIHRRSLRALDDALRLILRGHLEPSQAAHDAGMERMAEVIAAAQTYSDLLGRARVWHKVDRVMAGRQYRDDPIPIEPDRGVPNVPFEEAWRDLVERDPRLEADASEVARLYREEQAFAVARAADQTLVERLQRYLADAKREGRGEVEAVRAISDLGDFTRAYSLTVYRTNLATAYSAGRRAQAAQPVVRDLLPAFRFSVVRDSNVRQGRPQDNGENHLAMDGYMAPTDHPVWQPGGWLPPIGYSCRCATRLVSLPELERLDPAGRWQRPPDPITLGARKHPRF